MNTSQLSRELRRIARREVPNGQPDLWPAIQRQLAQSRPGVPSAAGLTGRSNLDPDFSSVYVWNADERRSRFGVGRALVAGVAVLALVAVLAVVLSNRGSSNSQRLAAGGVASSNATATPSTVPQTPWPSNGKIVAPVEPLGDPNASGTVTAQILPNGDVRISGGVESATDQYTWHVVPQSCAATAGQTEEQIAANDIVPAYVQMGLYPSFVPAAKSHQPLTLVAFTKRGDPPVACASIPAVPNGFNATYQPASIVPVTCPVTLPSKPAFTPSAAGSSQPSVVINGDYWYGSDDLWTGLPLDGVWNGLNQKVFWWSIDYSVNAEPIPALSVWGTRLDGVTPPPQVDTPTNANGQMLVVVDFQTGGCWSVTGEYENHTVHFVVWVTDGSANQFNQAPGPMPASTPVPTPGADGLTHTDLECHATSFGPSTATPSDVNVELRGLASSGQFWALLYQQMPIYAGQTAQFVWKMDSPDTFTLTVEDTNGHTIVNPSTYVQPSTPTNWPRPGTEWDANITFPSSGCWHVRAESRDVTGDMWFEVLAPPPATPVMPTVATPKATAAAVCPDVSNLEPNADWGGYGLAHAGPLWFSAFGQVRSGKAVITDFSPGYPTKVVIHPDASLQGSMQLQGFNCETGQVLHFCYGEGTCGFTGQQVTEAELSQRGVAVATIQGHLDATGYILFPQPGFYRLWVEQDGQEVGSVVMQVTGP